MKEFKTLKAEGVFLSARELNDPNSPLNHNNCDYSLIGIVKDLTDEDCIPLVASYDFALKLKPDSSKTELYKNYVEEDGWFLSARDSFLSLIEFLGLDENPLFGSLYVLKGE